VRDLKAEHARSRHLLSGPAATCPRCSPSGTAGRVGLVRRAGGRRRAITRFYSADAVEAKRSLVPAEN